MKPKILFVTYGAGHAAIVAKIAARLREDARFRFGIVGLTTAGSLLDTAGLPFSRCVDYLPLPGYEKAAEIGAELSRPLWHESTGIPFEESCAYLGVSMVDLMSEVGIAEAQRRYAEQGRKSFCPVPFLEHVLRHEAPQVVVTSCHVRMERAAVIAAKQLGIPTVLIEDLFGYATLGEATFYSGIPVIPPPERHDYIMVLNSWVRDHLVRAGIASDRIMVTGQPVFSEWRAEVEQIELSGICQRLKADPRSVVTYATPARRDVLYEQSQQICDLARRRPDLLFVIKLHPSVSTTEFEQHMPPMPENLHVVAGIEIKEVIPATDVMVVFRSTVGLLSLFSGVPVVVVDCTGDPEFIPYVSENAAIGVNDYQELEAAIMAALARTQESALSPVFENTLNATENMIEFFARLTGARSGTLEAA